MSNIGPLRPLASPSTLDPFGLCSNSCSTAKKIARNHSTMISFKTTEKASYVSSAETIATNVDLLNQILLRLPTKSLLKFKCVSKLWQSLISSPIFSRCLKSHVNTPCALMVENFSSKTNSFEYEFVSLHCTHSETPFKSLNFVNGSGETTIRQSCNGLLLCASYDKSRKDIMYYVCNPTTKQYVQLPPLEWPRSVAGVNLAFDPSKSPHYKVVCVRCDCSLEEDCGVVYEIDVYSSKQRRWTSSTAGQFTISGYIEVSDGVFWNGAIHWLSSRWDNSLYFDVDEDQLHEMPAPHIPEDWTGKMVVYFGESRGHLHLVEIELPSIKFNVYEMCEDYSGWNVKYQVDLSAVVTAFPDMVVSNVRSASFHHYIFDIVCVSRGETDKDSFLVLHIPSKSIRVNLKDGTSFEKLCDFGPNIESPPCYKLPGNTYSYFQSLASV